MSRSQRAEQAQVSQYQRLKRPGAAPTLEAERKAVSQPTMTQLPPAGDRRNRGTLSVRQNTVLRMQQQFGNRAVQRMLAPTVQRDDDDEWAQDERDDEESVAATGTRSEDNACSYNVPPASQVGIKGSNDRGVSISGMLTVTGMPSANNASQGNQAAVPVPETGGS
jgi:hypothetical protein